MPHRPTKGLSERLRRPFGASPFGNLRAQMLSYILEISVRLAWQHIVVKIAKWLMCNVPVSDKMVVQGGSVVKNIVISMQNTLLSEAVARTLAETREFRVEQILPGHADDTLSLCETVRADILLMEVSRLNAYTLESRLSLIDRVRRKIKACKFVLLCDENSDMELAHRVMHARQDRLIDAFLYASVTPAYLAAALDAL